MNFLVLIGALFIFAGLILPPKAQPVKETKLEYVKIPLIFMSNILDRSRNGNREDFDLVAVEGFGTITNFKANRVNSSYFISFNSGTTLANKAKIIVGRRTHPVLKITSDFYVSTYYKTGDKIEFFIDGR